jgi:hypothetical protein
MKRTVVLLGLAAFLAGCAFGGPASLHSTRADYNLAIQQTNEQELLLNLVRLRYRDTIYFMNVEKIASTAEFTRGLGASATLPAGAANIYTLGPGTVTIAEKPTIFYAPLEGERFARQMMSVISPEVLILLANSGWSIERLMVVTTQQLNGLKNAPTAAGPTPDLEPEYREFRAAVRHLRSLQQRRLLELGRVTGENQHMLELRFAPGSAEDPDAMEFRRLLGLRADLDRYPLVPGLGRSDGDRIHVVPRSLMGVLNYMSQAIEVPKGDEAAGLVTLTRSAEGLPFDWQAVFGGLFRVSSSDAPPAAAAVAVRYRNAWFYVRDDDLDSKSTFSLLAQLMALQAGPLGARETPISFSIGG